jgi:hypothetical protein
MLRREVRERGEGENHRHHVPARERNRATQQHDFATTFREVAATDVRWLTKTTKTKKTKKTEETEETKEGYVRFCFLSPTWIQI